MRLAELLQDLPEARIEGPADAEVQGVACDSRRVVPGGLFVAIRGGQERDRHQFVDDAVARGAVAVVVEEPVTTTAATCVQVPDARLALARLAARFHGHPADSLLTVGVTGTNGKTTTALLVRSVLAAAGLPAAYLGTLGSMIGGQWQGLANTTPEAADLHGALRAAVDAGDRAVAMEVSSHALALERVEGLAFDAAAFTNLTRDHLDFHGSEEAYFAAKARLFTRLRRTDRPRAAINADDPWGARLLAQLGGIGLGYGLEVAAAVRPRRTRYTASGIELTVETPRGAVEVRTSLTGPFNCSNVVAAVACGTALELEGEAITCGIAAVDQVPGRFERIDEGQEFLVIVDYAHTPAGLENVLRAARSLAARRLICLFGCGGDRDRGKRPLMGQVAEALADVVVLSTDNPRSEDPGRIIAQIAAGMKGVAAREVEREAGIRRAIEAAEPGDVVVIAGKGDERYQAFADGTVAFDDREVARRVLRDRGARG